MATSTSLTKKKIRQHIGTSISAALEALHIQHGSKKVKKLVEKTSKQITNKVLKELKKEQKAEAKKAKRAKSTEKKKGKTTN